ncbi:MAG: recombinase family protein [Planctomycetes bacterium]|nr:recombinase family protein [Planctomycetota bacterium]
MTRSTKSNRVANADNSPKATVRVAIYTRKSDDDGLEQEFNSLDAQREAVEAYVLSQRGEGWVALPDHYDDGGYSGKNTVRPGFQRLLQDLEAGKVDVVAVYKIDRLSRSLIDFVQIMQLFEQHGVSFVSVTQRFDTSSSMGQLMLNILMSFAQFERQVISERTRDKMRATRRRGLWTGGAVPLGYNLVEKKLVLNPTEADQVREIFKLYLDLGSILLVAQELTRRGWKTKSWTIQNGEMKPGRDFDKHLVRNLLGNPVYVGQVKLHGELFPGAQEAIIPEETWNAVQHLLRNNTRVRYRHPSENVTAILQGLIRCASCGSAMSPNAARKGNRIYPYYCCQTLMKRGADACPGSRVPAGDMEHYVLDHIRSVGRDPKLLSATIKAAKKEIVARKPELEAELRRLDKEKQKLSSQRKNLLDAIEGGGAGKPAILERLGDVDTALNKAQDRTEGIGGELAAIDNRVIDEADLRKALTTFDPIWDALLPAEKARVLQLLIEQVTYDAKADEVAITFRPGGVRMLAKDERSESA